MNLKSLGKGKKDNQGQKNTNIYNYVDQLRTTETINMAFSFSLKENVTS